MKMNMFVRELKANVKSLLIWGGIVLLFCMVGFAKYSAYADNPELLAILDSVPKPLLDAFQLNAFNLTTITGFFGVMFNYFALLLSIAAVMWGSEIIVKEERDRTAEFALVLPVSRSQVITAKALATVVKCVALSLIMWVSTLIATATYQPDAEFYRFLFSSMVALFMLQMVFMAVGLFLGCAMRQHKQVSATAVSILLGTYFLSLISSLNENLDFLKYVTPFEYVDPALILNESRVEVVYIVLSVVLVAIFVAGSYITYERRDLYV